MHEPVQGGNRQEQPAIGRATLCSLGGGYLAMLAVVTFQTGKLPWFAPPQLDFLVAVAGHDGAYLVATFALLFAALVV
jgi:hypothetical protein